MFLFNQKYSSDASPAFVFVRVAIFLAGWRIPAGTKNDDDGNNNGNEAAVKHEIKQCWRSILDAADTDAHSA